MLGGLGQMPNRGPPLATIAFGAEQPAASVLPDDELLRMFSEQSSPRGSSSPPSLITAEPRHPFELSGDSAAAAGASSAGTPAPFSTTPPVTPVKLQRAPLSWSGSGGSSDSEVALWGGIVHAMSPSTEQRVMHERLAEVPRAARRLIPNWRDDCLPEVQPLVGASGCAFRLWDPTDGAEYFVRLLRASVSRDARLVSVTRTAAAAGVGPAVVGADAGAMVQRWCAGAAPDSQQYREPQHARRLGSFIASMHKLPDPPETSETRTLAAAVMAARLPQPAPAMAQTLAGLSLAFGSGMVTTAAKPPLPGPSMVRCSSDSALWAMQLTASPERKSASAIPHAAHGPLQRNGVEMSKFEDTWEVSERLQAAALQPNFGRCAALVWSHGDLHLQNLLEVQDGSGSRRLQVIDLETVAKRPAATDLANLFRFWRFPPLGTRRALVDGYLGDAAADKEAVDAMLWGIECCMPVCITRWIVSVMTAPDAMGGDPSAARVRQAVHFLPLLERAVAVLREASEQGGGAGTRRKEVIDRGIWAVVGLPALDRVFAAG